MPTLVLNAFSKAYPAITNRIRAAIYLAELPLAIVTEIIDTTPGHPARTWSFPGLERTNYKFSLDEIDSLGTPLSNLALFDVVPGTIQGSLVRDDEQIKVDTTPGFNDGSNTFTFDGTGGKPNYIGWEIVPSELTGRGILVKGLDYSWDKDTGVFTLLQFGDAFISTANWNIHFNPIDTTQGNSYPTLNDYQFNIVTEDITIDASYFGKKLICNPSGNFMTVTLPNIYTIVPGRRLMIEVDGSNQQCVQILTALSYPIPFFKGMIYLLPGERLSIYSMMRAGEPELRFCDAYGNFTTVGNMVSTDNTYDSSLNMIPLDGRMLNTQKYARLYNQFVLELPIDQVVNFADWGIGNNRCKYSYSDGTVFHVPDRSGIYEVNNSTGKAGDFIAQSLQEHEHFTVVPISKGDNPNITSFKSIAEQNQQGSNNNFKYTLTGDTARPTVGRTSLYGGTKTNPNSVIVNKYVLV